jgi:hypothetical protein
MLKSGLVLEKNNIGKNKTDESIKQMVQVRTSERTLIFHI